MHINSLNSIYRLPVLLVLAVSVSIFVSCGGSQSKYDKIIKEAELISLENSDSALLLLDIIDPNELTVDSIKAKYYLLTASIHDKQGHVMLSDSLIRHTSNYFKNKDLSRAIKSATLVALYDYWVGNDRYAIEQLDSLSNLVNVPDSMLIYPLRKRAYLGTKIKNIGWYKKSLEY